MEIKGKEIAAEIFRELENTITHLDTAPHLTIVCCAPEAPSRTYIRMKQKRAATLGIEITVSELPVDTTTEECIAVIQQASLQTDGIIVQLPLPSQLDTDRILASIPPQLDVDAVHFNGTDMELLPPVVGAIEEIARRAALLIGAGSLVIVGHGRLVGAPAAVWADQHGWQYTVADEHTPNAAVLYRSADTLILGAGQPRLITPDMIKDGVIIFDAGTSEDAGELVGDADPACHEKATLQTPVPGGIGPVALAVLFRNLVMLHTRNQKA